MFFFKTLASDYSVLQLMPSSYFYCRYCLYYRIPFTMLMEFPNTDIKDKESFSSCEEWSVTEGEAIYEYLIHGEVWINKSKLLDSYAHSAFKRFSQNEYNCYKINHIVDLVILPVLGIIGIIGNICGIASFSRKAKQTYYLLLLCLAISDLVTIVAFIFYYSFPNWVDHYTLLENPFCTYLILCAYSLLQVAQLIDIYLLIALSIERYLAICHPLMYRSRKIPSIFYIIAITIISFCYSIPLFLEHKVKSSPAPMEKYENRNGSQQFVKNTKVYLMKHTDLKLNPTYHLTYEIVCKLVIMCVIPYVLLLTTNFLMVQKFCNLKRMPRKEEEEDQPLADDRESLKGQDSMRIHTNSREMKVRQSQVNLAFLNLSITVVFLMCYSLRWFWSMHDLVEYLSQVMKQLSRKFMINKDLHNMVNSTIF